MNNRILRWFCVVSLGIFVVIAFVGVLAVPVSSAPTMTVIARVPTLNQLDVAADSNIVVTFSANINSATVNPSTFNVDGSFSGRIAGAYSTSNTVVTFNPTAKLKRGETLTVTLTTGIESVTGNTLVSPVTWQFIVDVKVGTATFPFGINFGPANDSIYSVALGDMDGDGALDIVAGNPQQNVVYKNNGTGSIWTGLNFGPANENTFSVSLGDIDDDGDLDIVAGNYGQENVVYKNNGTGTIWTGVNFGPSSDKTTWLTLGDVDGDGDLDIVVGKDGGQNVVYKNDGSGVVWTPVNFGPAVSYTYSVALGDVDSDGDQDIVAGNNFGQNIVYKNDGTGSVWTGVNFGTGSDNTHSLALGDIDGDGDLDIVAGNIGEQSVVYFNNGNGTNWTQGVTKFGTGTVALGDVDGDGDLDIVVGNYGQSVVYKNDGTGTGWTGINFGIGGNSADLFALGDVDGDADLDLVAVNLSQNVVYKNRSPDIGIEGNSIEVVNGDVTPSMSDFTDFGGETVVGGIADRTYTIKNTGDGELTISGSPKVNLNGTNAADFSVTTQPMSPIPAATGNTTFTIRFDPSALGLRTATVIISNDDSDKNPFTFAIQGTGAAEIVISPVPVSSNLSIGLTIGGFAGVMALLTLRRRFQLR